MSTVDFDHIRALLIAQTADPEPKARGVFGRLFTQRAERPRPLAPVRPVGVLDLATPLPEEVAAASRSAPPPTPPDVAAAPVETASLLPPPAPRAAFGRRPDVVYEPELVLDQPATAARRLQLLDPSGQPVGEMILHPDEPPMRLISTIVREEVPFFPEDLLDPDPPVGPEPLRPWLKALRKSGTVAAAAATDPAPASPTSEVEDSAPLTKRVRARRTRPPAAPKRPPPPSFGHDLLEALALTLAREQETLSDRLLAVAETSLFRDAAADAVAA